MSRLQFRCTILILRHAWLNLWDKHMTTGRINQVAAVWYKIRIVLVVDTYTLRKLLAGSWLWTLWDVVSASSHRFHTCQVSRTTPPSASVHSANEARSFGTPPIVGFRCTSLLFGFVKEIQIRLNDSHHPTCDGTLWSPKLWVQTALRNSCLNFSLEGSNTTYPYDPDQADADAQSSFETSRPNSW